ncbi:MerR family transcriptional regulator [Paenibacillus spiritus]|uniref:MerR family transcriptional regulator n=1 Tax=Paenibacillus spiritus TaxID=2496557 RepID=A0A5J5GBB9_9BACL|nr:MerR family transcriptional regulator [Paenibacillus spiritus]KAA9005406.1 MerR family transcriptional regulator [Paenibacillus spiritus]
MLRIGIFSNLSRISIRMLRHYDEIGLLVPESIDESTGYRYYSEAQLLLAARIQAFKNMGFGLNSIREIIRNCPDSRTMRQYLLNQQSQLAAQAAHIGDQLQRIEDAILQIGKEESLMKYSITLKEMPERQVASLRAIIPAYDQEGLLWEKMMRELAMQQVPLPADEPCLSMAIFHDSDYKEQNPDVEIQLPVQGSFRSTGDVVFKREPSMLAATVIYQGSYAQLSEVNRAIAEWVRDTGYQFDGPMFNIYHVSPSQTSNPDEWVTEVCYPVIRA